MVETSGRGEQCEATLTTARESGGALKPNVLWCISSLKCLSGNDGYHGLNSIQMYISIALIKVKNVT